jgi:tRNA pseudouridine38-40 synthase
VSSGDDVRIRLTLHYDGSAFHGWQLQPEVPTVQGAVESVVERITGARRPLLGSGRTDAGVHASGQVATVSVPSPWTGERLRTALNALLPPSIWVQEARRVPFAFHPRYDARARSYRYRVGTAEATRSPFHRPFCWALAEALEPSLLAECAAVLPGRHSFRSFAKSGQPERGEMCEVHAADWSPWILDGVALGHDFTITANRYLHHMVRYLVGTMVAVARGRRRPDEVARLLHTPDGPERTSPPAPPEGLYLERVEYRPGAEDFARDEAAASGPSPRTRTDDATASDDPSRDASTPTP